MDDRKKEGRYQRLYTQLEALCNKTKYPLARMASICAVLHHKMEYFFWTGFYLLEELEDGDAGLLVVGPYQGPVACQELMPGKGVCWAAVEREAPVVVPDVHAFPGHHACDARSQSEITLPVKDSSATIRAVFDVDSDTPGSFTETDRQQLQKILELVYK